MCARGGGSGGGVPERSRGEEGGNEGEREQKVTTRKKERLEVY